VITGNQQCITIDYESRGAFARCVLTYVDKGCVVEETQDIRFCGEPIGIRISNKCGGPFPATHSLSAGGPNTLCFQLGPIDYEWTYDDGTGSVVLDSGTRTTPNGFLVNRFGFNAGDPNYFPSGEYCFSATNAAGCLLEECIDYVLECEEDCTDLTGTYVVSGGGCGVPATLDISASGGSGPYDFKYIWTNNCVSCLTDSHIIPVSNSYAVTIVDQVGCQLVLSETIILDPPLLANLQYDVSICEDETNSIFINITSGTGPYSINVYGPGEAFGSNGNAGPTISVPYELLDNDVEPGTYSYVITDANGCTYTDEWDITVTSCMVDCEQCDLTWNIDGCIATVSFDETLCPGAVRVYKSNNPCPTDVNTIGSAQVTNMNPGTSFMFDDNATYTLAHSPPSISACPPKIFECFVASCDEPGCPEIVIDVLQSPASCCENDECLIYGSVDITVSGGNPPYTYLWEEPFLPFTSTDEDLTGLFAGFYSLTVTDEDGCMEILSGSGLIGNEPCSCDCDLSITYAECGAVNYQVFACDSWELYDKDGILVNSGNTSGNFIYGFSNGQQTVDQNTFTLVGMDAGCANKLSTLTTFRCGLE